MLFHEKVIIAL